MTHARLSRRQLLSLSTLACAPLAKAAAPEANPVILTLTGKVKGTAGAEKVDLTMAQIQALPQHTFTTHTPWDPQPRRFTGPLLRDLLSHVGAQGEQLQAIALNDYRVAIPMSDARQFQVIVARLIDDQPMRVRDRGPLFIVYPFDSDAELRNDRYYARSAWQLRRIEVR